jgi:ankyrin repeat protein
MSEGSKGHEALVAELNDAVRSGDAERLTSILRRHPSLVDGIDRGLSPLALAIYSGREDVAHQLIKQGAHVDIFMAAALGEAERVGALLNEEPELIVSYSEDGWTPLHLAAFFGREEVARMLLRRHAQVNLHSRSPEGNTPLHAAVAGKQPALVGLLLEHGADVDAADSLGWTPLNHAAHEGVAEIVESLLRHGADPTIPSDDGRTPLETALSEGHPELVRYFEDANPD